MKKKNLGKESTRKRRTGDVPVVELSNCKYDILRHVLKKHGWEEAGENEKNWHLLWTDTSIGPEKLLQLKRGQKVNHFYGMLEICRKKALAKNLLTMRKMFPAQYKFFPRSFLLPGQLPLLMASFNVTRVKTFILKPDNGCQGKGVVLAQSVADVKDAIQGMNGANFLAQKYLTNPMLLEGYKFDLRIYALMLSCDPLRLYLYREGIARFCTEKYMKPDSKNLRHSCMHLTNYSVNKYNPKFKFNNSDAETDKGHKWSMSALLNGLAVRGFDTAKLLRQISHIVVMTLISIVPILVHNYKSYLSEDQGETCFELLGLDVLLDDKCRPWLLEVNHSPSFSIDTPLDRSVKEALISDTLRLAHIDPSVIQKARLQEKKGAKMRLYGKTDHAMPRKSSPQEEKAINAKLKQTKDFEAYETANKGKFERIYPSRDDKLQKLYNVLLAGSQEAFQHSFDMKMRENISKVREGRKQEELDRDEAERRKEKAAIEARRKAAQERARLVAQLPREELEHSRQRMNFCLERLGMDGTLAADLQGAEKGELYKAVVRPLSQLGLYNTPAFTPRSPLLQAQSPYVPSSYQSCSSTQPAHFGGLLIRGMAASPTPPDADDKARNMVGKFVSKHQDWVPRTADGSEQFFKLLPKNHPNLAPVIKKPHINIKYDDFLPPSKRAGLRVKPEELALKLEELQAMTRCEPQELGGTSPFCYRTEIQSRGQKIMESSNIFVVPRYSETDEGTAVQQTVSDLNFYSARPYSLPAFLNVGSTICQGSMLKKSSIIKVRDQVDDTGPFHSRTAGSSAGRGRGTLPKLDDYPDWRFTTPMSVSTTISRLSADIPSSSNVRAAVAIAAARAFISTQNRPLHVSEAALAEAEAALTTSANTKLELPYVVQLGKPIPLMKTF